MNDTTAEWLNPMLAEAEARQLDTTALIRQASMPAAEMDWGELGDPTAIFADIPGVRLAIDWIRFGQVLRAELGWLGYPDQP